MLTRDAPSSIQYFFRLNQFRSLWGQLSRSKASPLTPEKAKERAKKAAAARWAAGAGRKKPRAKKGKALNGELSDCAGENV